MLFPVLVFSQFGNIMETPVTWHDKNIKAYPGVILAADKSEIEKLVAIEHASYICATAVACDVSFTDFQLTKVLPNGDKIYHYQIKSDGALGLRVHFENLKLSDKARIWICDRDRNEFIGSYRKQDQQGDNYLLSSIIHGNTAIIEYLEPKSITTTDFKISKVHHFFRGLKGANGYGDAESCLINVACNEGLGYTQENLATCRILVTGPSFSGWCTGTLMNNTSENLSPIIFTANHCSANSSLSDLANWEYHFYYQSTGCANPVTEPNFLRFSGSTALAYSGSDNGDNSSDFLLLKMNQEVPAAYDLTFMGWDRSGGPPSSGVGIHHPQGDIKKISTYSGGTGLATYKFKTNSHFEVQWKSTGFGRHSVTEQGSSGSCLLNDNKLFVGTLTGGGAACNNLNAPDYYGRLAMHWNSYGSNSNQRVDVWLDPLGINAVTQRSIKRSLNPLSVKESLSEKELNISITDHFLNLTWALPSYQLSIYNLLGELITKEMIQGQNATRDIANFPHGVYLIEVENYPYKVVKKIVL